MTPLPETEYDGFSIAHVPSCPEPFRLINRVPIADNGEPLVDLRETNPELSFNDYCLPYVREGVALRLKEAFRRLPSHLDLRVFTALRTLDQQAEMYWGNYRRAQEEHPNWPESVLRKMTNRFFAPPDAKAPPGHCTGGAVDVGLFLRESGEGLDLRSPLEGWNAAPTAALGLHPESMENRRLLCYLMHSTGLSNCRDEYWHWSYGDSAWAVRVGAGTACYGLIGPPDGARRVVGGKVEVVPYDPSWLDAPDKVRDALAATLSGHDYRIEHVGSTSVHRMSARPVLDLELVVEGADRSGAVVEALKVSGYELQGEAAKNGRQRFQAKDGHQLSICMEGDQELRSRVAVRDYLRSNSEVAAKYSELRMRLAELYPWDRVRYEELREPFLVGMLTQIDLT